MSVSATGGSKATTSSSPKSNAGASASASANAGGAAKAQAGAQTGGAQSGGATGSSAAVEPSDSVKIDRAETADSSGVSSALMSGLSEAYGAEEASPTANAEASAEVGGTEEAPNPYEGIADHTVSMSPEKWTSDRTPAEGQVARNDHLEGMLRNQGFSLNEIYSKDGSGQSMMERVAEVNGLQNPDLINPEQSLTLPTRHAPAEASAEAAAEGNTPEAVTADAVAEVTADKIENSEAVATATAEATNHGEGAAEASADARVEVQEAVNSELEARAEATAQANQGPAEAVANSELEAGRMEGSSGEAVSTAEAVSAEGPAEAVAAAEMNVEEAVESQLEASSTAEAVSGQGPAEAVAASELNVTEAVESELTASAAAEALSAEGPAVAEASSEIEVAEAVDSTLTAESVAAAETLSPVAPEEAQAVAAIEAEQVESSTLATEAVAVTPEAAAVAETKMEAEQAEGVSLEDVAAVTPAGPSVSQEGIVLENQGELDVEMDAHLEGEGSVPDQSFEMAGDGPAKVEMSSDAEEAAQSAVNYENEGTPFTGPQYDPADPSESRLVSEGAEFSDQQSAGFANSHLEANGAELGTMGSDAQNATYEGQGNGRVVGYHTGQNGNVNLGVEAGNVYFKDGAPTGMGMHQPTGNEFGGTVTGSDVKLDLANSADYDGRLQGTEGDDRHEVILPSEGTGNGNNLAVDQGAGNDFLVTSGGTGDISLSKNSGTMNLAVDAGRGEGTEVALDAGTAAVKGDLDLREVENAIVQLQTDGAAHDAIFRGGDGDSDTLVVRVDGDAAAPKVVLGDRPGLFGNLFGGPDEVASGTASEGNIYAPGFENVVIMRDGVAEALHGELPQDLAGFEEVQARIAEATALENAFN